jgi:hypothetical protein
MRRVYLISYDVKRDDNVLINAIKSYGTWWGYAGVWMIATPANIDSVYAYLKPYFFNNEHFLVIEIRRNYTGWLPQNAWNWLNDNTPFN